MSVMKEKTENRKQAVDFHINEDTITDSSYPVDYSFFKYKELKPVECEQARITRLGDAPERGRENKKYLTRGIWLNNNKLASIKGLDTLVEAVLEFPERLAWIDFSYNYIKKIDEVILKFPNLTIVNFHGNKISDITQVAKLRALKKLRNITFHGNPIAHQLNYRPVIIAYLPTIVHLDFQPVLKSERLEPVHPQAIKYLKALADVKPAAEDEDVAAVGPHRKEKITAEVDKEQRPKESKEPPKLERPKAQMFTSKGPCACELNRKLLHNDQLT